MRNRLEDPQLISEAVIMNMLISYREVQNYSAMVSLVEDVAKITNNNVTNKEIIMYHYAFALNR